MIPRSEVHHIDLSDVATGETIGPVTPGEVLAEEFMRPLGVSARALGRGIDVPHNRILDILKGERAITAETALRLGRRFGTFWMNLLQAAHELDMARGRHLRGGAGRAA